MYINWFDKCFSTRILIKNKEFYLVFRFRNGQSSYCKISSWQVSLLFFSKMPQIGLVSAVNFRVQGSSAYLWSSRSSLGTESQDGFLQRNSLCFAHSESMGHKLKIRSPHAMTRRLVKDFRPLKVWFEFYRLMTRIISSRHMFSKIRELSYHLGSMHWLSKTRARQYSKLFGGCILIINIPCFSTPN